MSDTLQAHIDALPAGIVLRYAGDVTIPITAPYVEDSREVQPGGVFVARKGLTVDGHDFIGAAIENGATAIVGERAIDLDVPYVQVRDAQDALGKLAAAYYGFPSRKLIVCGVTGTNGKTTTIHLLHSILNAATDGKAGFISTIGADFGGSSADTGLHVTTPHASDVQRYLAEMVEAGLTHVVLEMTSHGLAQGRLNGIDLDVAILTNITHEHLDFHGSFEAYRDAKALMFRMLAGAQRKSGTPKISVLNADDDAFEYLAEIDADEIISYSIHDDEAMNQAARIDYAPDATAFYVGRRKYHTRLVGEFNVYNALAAISAAQALDIDDQFIKRGLKRVDSISGRMQRIDEGQDFIAIVDFAHTPDALEKALAAARQMLVPGKRLIAVYGSAGLRDIEKRYLMAQTSARLADVSVLTAEDPRTESLDHILQMMADGCISQGGVEGETFIRVPDRGEALYQACQMAEPGDLVIACGKGHEQSMCFGTTEFPWDDRDAMRAALRGAPLQTLPTAPDTTGR